MRTSLSISTPIFPHLTFSLARAAPFVPPFYSKPTSIKRCSSTMRPFPNRPRDIQDFLQGYPGGRESSSLRANLDFYLDKQSMRPDKRTFTKFMNDTEGDYDELEMNHSYIQWLFPIREHGVNPSAQPLQKHEAETMAKDESILNNILRSYTMMLDFYGIDFNKGQLKLSKNYEDRFYNLSHASHNLLRLTRILKHLSEITPLQPHAAPLTLFFAAAHSEGLLNFTGGVGGPMAGQSMDRWWTGCFRDEAERKEVGELVAGRGGYGKRAWGFDKFDEWYKGRVEKGKMGWGAS